MKRIVAVLLFAAVMMSTACSADIRSIDDKDLYCGTWICIGAEYDGIFYTSEKYDELNGTSLSCYYFVLKDDGIGYDYLNDGSVDEYSWEESENGVIIDGMDFIRQDNYIVSSFNGLNMYYKKESSDQTFPNKEKDKAKPSAPAVTVAPPTAESETTSPPMTTAVSDTFSDEQPAQSSASTETPSISTTAKPETTSPTTTKAPETAPSTTTQKQLTSISTTAKPETTSPPATKAPETAPSTTTQKRLTEDDIRPEFKELMDQYEAFFDDYIAFMKKYMSASSDDPMTMLGMLQDYLDWLEKYSEIMEDFEDVGDSDLTRAETFYYAEVALRIEQKLLSVMY